MVFILNLANSLLHEIKAKTKKKKEVLVSENLHKEKRTISSLQSRE